MLLSIPELIAASATGAAVAIGVGPISTLWLGFAERTCAKVLADAATVRIDRGVINNWLRWWGPALLAAVIGIGIICRAPVLAVPAVVLIAAAPRILISMAVDRRRKELRRQLVPAMSGLANTSRAGMPISQGLASVAEELPQPLRVEFDTMVAECRGGRPLARVLEDAKNRLGLEPFTLFATALQTQGERGGSATDLLETLSENLRDVERLDRTMDAATAGNRSSIFILAVFPFVFLLAMFILLPRETSLMFTTLLGQAMLLAAIALTCASVSWSRSLLKFRG